MSLFDDHGWYTHNGDADLARELGLRDTIFPHGEWTDVGEVQVDRGRVQVEVIAFPAQFWRFTCTHDSEGEGYPERTTVLRTGSGSFASYWPIAEKFAAGMVVVA